MVDLTSKKRAGMPKKDFAGPEKSFPISDPTHARLAISGATRSERAGNISSGEEAAIKARARAKLGDKRQDDRKEGREKFGEERHSSKGSTKY
jgi:hypothetical protein